MQELNLPSRGQNPMPCRLAYPLCESVIIRLAEITLDGFHTGADTPIPVLRRHPLFSATPYGVGGGGRGAPLALCPLRGIRTRPGGCILTHQPRRRGHNILCCMLCILRDCLCNPRNHCAPMNCGFPQLGIIIILLSCYALFRRKREFLYRLRCRAPGGLCSLRMLSA